MFNVPVEQLRRLKIGDVVTIERNVLSGKRPKVTAPIIKIERRWGSDAVPMITLEGHDTNWLRGAGEDPDFENCLEVGAHMVLRIDEIGPYMVHPKSPENHFAKHMAEQNERPWNHPRYEQPKGLLCGYYGDMDYLFLFALSKLKFDLDGRSYHPEKARKCWEKAGKPGLIKEATKDRTPRRIADLVLPTHLYVSEKHFCAFVRRNWSRIVCTVKEMNQNADEYARMQSDSMAEDLDMYDDALDRKFGRPSYPGDEEDRALWADQDFEEERAFQNGGY